MKSEQTTSSRKHSGALAWCRAMTLLDPRTAAARALLTSRYAWPIGFPATIALAVLAMVRNGKSVLRPLAAVAAAMAYLPVAQAHPVSVTRTLVVVQKDQAKVTIEVFLEDLYLFHGLKADSAGFLSHAQLTDALQKHRHFVSDRFRIRDAEGNTISPESLPTVSGTIPEQGVPLPELMVHKLVFDLTYRFSDPPEFLTFEQEFGDLKAVLPSEMQFKVMQYGSVTLFDGILLQTEPVTIRFDWTTVPPDSDASEQQRQQWLQQQAEQTLGLSSYSSIYVFLYLEDDGTRVEVLIPLSLLEDFVRLPRTDPAFLEVSEQDTARPAIEEFLRNNIEIRYRLAAPGQTASNNTSEAEAAFTEPFLPTVQKCEFFGISFRDLAGTGQRKKVSMASGRVGVVLSYATPNTSADAVQLTWNIFSRAAKTSRLIVIDGDRVSEHSLLRTAGRNVFVANHRTSASSPPRPVTDFRPQKQFLTIPIVPVVCLALLAALSLKAPHPRRRRTIPALVLLSGILFGRAVPGTEWQIPKGYSVPDDTARQDICRRLLQQAYQSFRYRTEDRIYDALAASVGGELLEQIYVDLKNGLTIQQQGGAVCHVREIRFIEIRPCGQVQTEQPAFECCCTWQIEGDVEHWGHRHSRTNQFSGILTVSWRDDAWKATHLTVEDEQQLSFETTVRTLSTRTAGESR